MIPLINNFISLYFLVSPKTYDRSLASTPLTTDNTTIDFGIFSSSDLYLNNGILAGAIAFTLWTRETTADASSGIDLDSFISFNNFNLDDLIKAGFDPIIANFIYKNLSSLKIRCPYFHPLVNVGETVYSSGSISSVGSSNLESLNYANNLLNKIINFSVTCNPDGTFFIKLLLPIL